MADVFFAVATRLHLKQAGKAQDRNDQESARTELLLAARALASDLMVTTTLPLRPRTGPELEAAKAEIGAAAELLTRIQDDLERAS